MDYVAIEDKWNKIWEQDGIYKFDRNRLDKKYYLLEMFSYPSGLSLHLGHWWNFGLSDSFGRFKRMQGYNVFQPMGFDAFGLPAENYALKTGIHPEDSTFHNISVMEQQLRKIGATFNWENELVTCSPEYYRWTQWIFVQLFKKGLAYQKEAPINWCPSCNTVIANEQVVEGVCERCGSEVQKRNMKQWFFKITNYAEELLTGLDTIDWPSQTKALQRNWIGKSIGAEVDFKTESGKTLTVFTTRADTLYGVTWIVIAPEHPFVADLVTEEQKDAVNAYVQAAIKKDEIERSSTVSEKTGVFTGSYAINPLNGKKVPIYVADYVIASYATGMVMGVAAHDARDYDFAKKYQIDIVRVIEDKNGKETDLPFCNYGKLVNSAEFSGMTSEEAKAKIVEKLEQMGAGRKKINYALRDWSVSRQRYWGCPIPVIHCPECGAVPVPETDLPVKLPHIRDYKPEGEGPLGKVESYMNVSCPHCGKPARRDPDTLDTFVCSSFYQLRYPEANHNDSEIFNRDLINKILPVDTYVGGIEHATGHLLYSRFITKFLRDIGCLDFDEPFQRLIHQGMILDAKTNKKISKRNGGKTADDYVNEYGSDTLRLFMMFSLNYRDGGPWNDENMKHMKAFLERVERIILKWKDVTGNENAFGKDEQELEFVLHRTIKEMTEGFEEFSFNTAVARYMELINAMYRYDLVATKNASLCKQVLKDAIKLLAPACPHFTEELWHLLGEKNSIHNESYPTFDATKLIQTTAEIAIQVNSKIVHRLVIDTSLAESDILQYVKSEEKMQGLLQGKTVVKEIYVPNRLVNFIVRN